MRHAGRAYVRAHGGARAAASTAVSGRAATRRLGGFLADVARGGVAAAATALGITNLVGRDAQSVLAAIVDALASDGALREEAIERKALIETLDEVFLRFDVEANGIEALNGMTAADVADLVALSITHYVNVRFQEELVSRIERGALTERDANTYASEIRDFIEANVRLDLSGVDVLRMDWNRGEGRAFSDAQYERAYRLLGGEA